MCLKYKQEGTTGVSCGPLHNSHESLTNPLSSPRKNPLFSIIYNFFSLLISWPTPYTALEKTLCRTTFEREKMKVMKGVTIMFEIYKVQSIASLCKLQTARPM